MDQNVKEINKIEGAPVVDSMALKFDHIDKFGNIPIPKRKVHQAEPVSFPAHFHLAISICYAFFLALGSVLWFYLLAFLLVRFRQRLNIKIISTIVRGLGVVLCIIGIYFGYMASKIFF